MTALIVGILGTALLSSCDRRPEGVLSDKEMVELMTDMQLAEAYADVAGKGGDYSSMKARLSEGVLSAHGVTQAQLDSSLLWYGKNIDEYNELFKKVDKQLDSRRRHLLAGSGIEKTDPMEGSLWPYPQHMSISKLGDSDNIRFSIPASDIIGKGDAITWKMHLHSGYDLKGMLGVDYSDGSSSIASRSLSGSQNIEMRLQTDSSRMPVRLYGVLRVRQESSLPIYADSILLLHSPLDTNKYYTYHSQTFVRPPDAKKKITKVAKDTVADSVQNHAIKLKR